MVARIKARMASRALAGSFGQEWNNSSSPGQPLTELCEAANVCSNARKAVTIRVRSGQGGIEFRESIRESSSEFPIKTGGERGIRTPDTAFDRITV